MPADGKKTPCISPSSQLIRSRRASRRHTFLWFFIFVLICAAVSHPHRLLVPGALWAGDPWAWAWAWAMPLCKYQAVPRIAHFVSSSCGHHFSSPWGSLQGESLTGTTERPKGMSPVGPRGSPSSSLHHQESHKGTLLGG